MIRFAFYKSHSGFYVEYGLAWDKNDVGRPVSSSCERWWWWLELDDSSRDEEKRTHLRNIWEFKLIAMWKVVRKKDESWYLAWPNVKWGGQSLRWRRYRFLKQKIINLVLDMLVLCSCKASKWTCGEGNWIYRLAVQNKSFGRRYKFGVVSK